MENWKAVVFLLAFGQGALLSLALIVKGIQKERSTLFLGIILYCLALELLNAWGMQVHYHRSPSAFPFWDFQSYLLLPVSVWFFANLTTNPDYVFRRKYWWFYVPACLEIVVRGSIRAYGQLAGTRLPSLLENPIWFGTTEVLPIIGMAVALWMYGFQLARYRRSLLGHPARLSVKDWVRIYSIFYFLLATTLIWAAGVLFHWPVFTSLEILLTLALLALGYIAYLDSTFFTLPALPKSKSTDKPEFIHYEDARELQRLQLLFQRDTLYSQSKLTLEDVAKHLHLPARYVSYLINTYYDSNFNYFVNSFRVEEVIRKLNDPREHHKTLLALALEAGFSSKSTFNQVFKQQTGQSPSHYLTPQKIR